MNQRQHKLRTAVLLFALLLTLTAVFSTGAAAGTAQPESGPYYKVVSEDGRQFYNVDRYGNPVEITPAAESAAAPRQKSGNLPASYDARNDNLVTPVKNQYSTGTCWAFSAISVLETNAIKKGLSTLAGTDYSEAHLSWFGLNPHTSDTNDPTYGDGQNLGTNGFGTGGNYLTASSTFFRGSGAANDADFPFTGNNLSTMQFSDSVRYNSIMRLKGCYRLDTDTTATNNGTTDFFCIYNDEDVKQAILGYGSVQGCYYDNNYYYNTTNDYTAYFNFNSTYDGKSNHAVTIVGWDDNFSKDNFNVGTRPQSNGAWIVKNSWGNNGSLTDGYMYISYEDVSLGWFAAYEAQSADTFDNLYTYNGVDYGTYFLGGTDNPVANVFTTDSPELLTQVGFFIVQPGTSYTVNVYTDLQQNFTDPTQGTLHENVASGTCAYQGYYSIDLAQTVALDADETYAVELVFTHTSDTNLISYEGGAGSCKAKQSYVYYPYLGGWVDCYPNVDGNVLNNVLITAMTKESHIHAWANPVVTAPTCTAKGFTTYTCTCGDTMLDNFTDMLGHAFGAYSCTDGVHTRSCTRTGCQESESAACTYTAPSVSIAATCESAGAQTKSCTVCGTTVSENIPALGHITGSYVHNPNDTHTLSCTRAGCTYSHTNACIFGEWTQTTAPACTVKGTESQTCGTCRYSKTREVDALGHLLGAWVCDDGTHTKSCTRTGCTYEESGDCTFGEYEIVDATCIADGSAARTCSVCNCTETAVISMLGHSMSEWTIADGTHSRSCTREGCEYTESGTCTLGEWKTGTNPGCTSEGSEYRTCLVCTYTQTQSIPPKGHTAGAWNTVVRASCVADGSAECRCISCNSIVETKALPATGHTPASWTVTLAPTCLTGGTRKQYCAICSTLLDNDTVPPKGHTPAAPVIDIAPTCNSTGVSRTLCEDCDVELSTAVIPVDTSAHSFGAWGTTSQPTCTQEGVSTRTCSRCAATQTMPVAKSAHPDANNDGYCDNCSAELYSHEEPTQKSFIDKLKDFFRMIADFFKRLFGG